MAYDSGDICIKLSQPTYWQGNLISGVVEVNVGVFRVKEVLVKIKGVEKTRLKLSPKDLCYTQKRDIFSEKVLLSFGKLIGHKLTFSFNYTLPSILPGTFSLEEGASNYGLIYYYVTATIQTRHQQAKNGYLKTRQPFKVMEKLNIPFARPSYTEQSNISLPNFGTLSASMWIDRNVYFPGETVLARLKINSTSVKPIQNISINLVQETEIQASGQKSQDVSIAHSEHQIPDLEPCFLGVRWVPLSIPSDTPLSSVLGVLVHVNYYVQVKFDNHLSVALPVIILIRQYFESEHAIRPPTAVLPPPAQIRPPWQPDSEAKKCNSCKTRFGIMTYKSHCRNCGKVFCRECVANKIRIPKLSYKDPARVCRDCEKIVAQTGGTKFQSPKQVLEAWHWQYSPQWIPQYKHPNKRM
eukprot:Phypoly_transcript_05698.p1 GENE.Phypoly_transcript_05698~~Phypoly_transcript_05698.p1  ORF type:complete len:411 (+),score=36.68 Phypoly_transcript_05698:237-1469(+)